MNCQVMYHVMINKFRIYAQTFLLNVKITNFINLFISFTLCSRPVLLLSLKLFFFCILESTNQSLRKVAYAIFYGFITNKIHVKTKISTFILISILFNLMLRNRLPDLFLASDTFLLRDRTVSAAIWNLLSGYILLVCSILQ